jgi:hypothetical protein
MATFQNLQDFHFNSGVPLEMRAVAASHTDAFTNKNPAGPARVVSNLDDLRRRAVAQRRSHAILSLQPAPLADYAFCVKGCAR